MNDYREFQFSWLMVVILIPIQLWMTYLLVNGIGDRPMTLDIFLFVSGLFLLVSLLFYGMTTKVDREKITLSFGIGLIRKKIQLNRIKSIDTVKNPWYYGWGIRLIPNGWLYNVSGLNAVELRFNDKNGVIRIGTKDSNKLKNEISNRLTKS